MKNIETKISGCCNPLKGEDIIAFVTQNSEIKIHSVDCQIVRSDSIDKSRLKKAEWIQSDSQHLVKLRLMGNSYESMFKMLIENSSDSKVLITAMERKPSKNDLQEILIEIEVKDVFHLQEFITKLNKSTEFRMIQRR
jgi:GTP pyrophosphokinase